MDRYDPVEDVRRRHREMAGDDHPIHDQSKRIHSRIAWWTGAILLAIWFAGLLGLSIHQLFK